MFMQTVTAAKENSSEISGLFSNKSGVVVCVWSGCVGPLKHSNYDHDMEDYKSHGNSS